MRRRVPPAHACIHMPRHAWPNLPPLGPVAHQCLVVVCCEGACLHVRLHLQGLAWRLVVHQRLVVVKRDTAGLHLRLHLHDISSVLSSLWVTATARLGPGRSLFASRPWEKMPNTWRCLSANRRLLS